jgi:hypothetical protein
MRDITQPPGICTLDPITLGAAALGGLGATLFGGGNKPSAAATPQAPPPQAQAPSQPTAKPQPPSGMAGASSFMGTIPTPPPTGQKTLLGQ